jgi:hypothetical protein
MGLTKHTHIIQIISWLLDQESLLNLSLVSKKQKIHNIICNEPGNKSRIIPVFEVSGSSILKFLSKYAGLFLE